MLHLANLDAKLDPSGAANEIWAAAMPRPSDSVEKVELSAGGMVAQADATPSLLPTSLLSRVQIGVALSAFGAADQNLRKAA